MASSSTSTWLLQSALRSASAGAALHLALLLTAVWSVAGACTSPPPTVSFSISQWSSTSGITLSQDARYAGNGSFVGLVTDFTKSTQAGALRSIPVAFIDPCTNEPVSFSTSFTFAIQGPDPKNTSIAGPADGMAFVIAPTPNVSASATGLGFYPGLKTVAVEIDTYQNDYDPAAPHVGLDINSLLSTATGDASAIVTDGPGTPQMVTMWVQYDAGRRRLAVSAAKAPAMKSQAQLLLSYKPLILTSIINPLSYVGFTASTGGGTELHFVYSWSFTTYF